METEQVQSAEDVAERERVKAKAEDLDNSSPFDVHCWSEYPEVNNAVNALYAELLSDPKFTSKKEGDLDRSDVVEIKKKHIKIVILDLYVKWLEDPTKYSSYQRGKNRYSEIRGRYNKLHISYKIVSVVDALLNLRYIENAPGFFSRETGKSRLPRMRASDKLINMIHAHCITPGMVERCPNTECIILREHYETTVCRRTKNNKLTNKIRDIPYDDTDETNQWRMELYAYNNLLRRTCIDIPHFPIDGVYGRSQKRKIKINRNNKFVRRIFANSSWKDGGRFWGGWWQRTPKLPVNWRGKILIDDIPTVEVDYSGHHIVILYAMEGIDYWATIGKDPYEISGVEQTDEMRRLLKIILLCSVNAENKKNAVKAVNWEINTNKEEYGWVEKEGIVIEYLIGKFAEEHEVISGKYFFTGVGINLQNIDSIMAQQVINMMTQAGIPCLCIHDSFIVQIQHEELLGRAMQVAYQMAIGGYVNLEYFEARMKTSCDDQDCLKREVDLEYMKRLEAHRMTVWEADYYKPDIPFTGSGISIVSMIVDRAGCN